jgi:hypothetical protein
LFKEGGDDGCNNLENVSHLMYCFFGFYHFSANYLFG